MNTYETIRAIIESTQTELYGIDAELRRAHGYSLRFAEMAVVCWDDEQGAGLGPAADVRVREHTREQVRLATAALERAGDMVRIALRAAGFATIDVVARADTPGAVRVVVSLGNLPGPEPVAEPKPKAASLPVSVCGLEMGEPVVCEYHATGGPRTIGCGPDTYTGLGAHARDAEASSVLQEPAKPETFQDTGEDDDELPVRSCPCGVLIASDSDDYCSPECAAEFGGHPAEEPEEPAPQPAGPPPGVRSAMAAGNVEVWRGVVVHYSTRSRRYVIVDVDQWGNLWLCALSGSMKGSAPSQVKPKDLVRDADQRIEFSGSSAAALERAYKRACDVLRKPVV